MAALRAGRLVRRDTYIAPVRNAIAALLCATGTLAACASACVRNTAPPVPGSVSEERRVTSLLSTQLNLVQTLTLGGNGEGGAFSETIAGVCFRRTDASVGCVDLSPIYKSEQRID